MYSSPSRVHFQIFLLQVRLLFASILHKYVTGGAITKKFKVHRERVKEYFEKRKEEKRRLILAKKDAKAELSGGQSRKLQPPEG